MTNPSGVNQFQKQPAYGDIKRLTQLTKSAPMSGAPVPAMGAPKRAQKSAGRRKSAAAPAPPTAPTQASYGAQLAVVWRQLSELNPNDPLFQYYAQKAQG